MILLFILLQAFVNALNSKFVSRVNQNPLITKPSTFYDWKNYSPPFFDSKDFSIDWENPIGNGSYAIVYPADSPNFPDASLVVKVLYLEMSSKVKREMLILDNLKELNITNIVPYFGYFHLKEKEYALVFSRLYGTTARKEFIKFDLNQQKYLMFSLFSTLKKVHENGIIHRDLKPDNIIFNTTTNTTWVLDWGLATFYDPGVVQSVNVASRYYKSPEVLLGFGYYDYGLDIWAVGCIFGAMLFKKEVMFKGKNTRDQLSKIVRVLGGKELTRFTTKTKGHLSYGEEHFIKRYKNRPRVNWIDLAEDLDDLSLISIESVDLLDRMLTFDPQDRISASEALEHPFFSDF